MYNLSNNEHTLTARVKILIGRMSDLSDSEIKQEFTEILHSPDTHASEATRTKWMQVMNEARGRVALMMAICNLHLAGDNLRSPDYKEPTKKKAKQ